MFSDEDLYKEREKKRLCCAEDRSYGKSTIWCRPLLLFIILISMLSRCLGSFLGIEMSKMHGLGSSTYRQPFAAGSWYADTG